MCCSVSKNFYNRFLFYCLYSRNFICSCEPLICLIDLIDLSLLFLCTGITCWKSADQLLVQLNSIDMSSEEYNRESIISIEMSSSVTNSVPRLSSFPSSGAEAKEDATSLM